MQIIRFSAENFQRLNVVEIEPDSELVEIRGRNAQGKTSVLDAIEAVLGGKSHVSACPVHQGRDEAIVRVETDEFTATREFSADGRTWLKVTTKAGARLSAGQTILDKVTSGMSFDPVALLRQKPADQREILRKVVGLDFADLDTEKAAKFSRRTDINREAKRLAGELTGIAKHEDVPEEGEDVEALMAQLDAWEEACARVAGLEREHSELRSREDRSQTSARDKRATAHRLIEEAEALESEAGRYKERADACQAKSEIARSEVPDDAPIRERIRSAEGINAKVRENARHASVSERLAAEEAKAEELSRRLKEIESAKRDALEAAEFPLPGLSFSDTGILLNNLPFEQASGAEKLRACVAIGAKLVGELRVLTVRDGSLLDSEGLRELGKIARERGCQVWIERVSEQPEGSGVYIEDGRVFTPVSNDNAAAE